MNIEITIIKGVNIKKIEFIGKPDLFVKFGNKNKMFKTKMIKNTENPIWNQTFSYVHEYKTKELVLEVHDEELFGITKLVGKSTINLEKLEKGKETEEKLEVMMNEKCKGTIEVKIKAKDTYFEKEKDLKEKEDSFFKNPFKVIEKKEKQIEKKLNEIGKTGYFIKTVEKIIEPSKKETKEKEKEIIKYCTWDDFINHLQVTEIKLSIDIDSIKDNLIKEGKFIE
jgi:Ca2+-dependent lipid-binding protein